MNAADVMAALEAYAHPQDAAFLGRFFKTGAGQYGEGDTFIGVRVPDTRTACKTFKDLPLPEVRALLESPVHEHRLAGVIILAERAKKADEPTRKEIYEFYLQAARDGLVNNWDIVDSSAEYAIGGYLYGKPRDVLFALAKSDDIWQRRVAMLSTFAFIKKGDASTTLQLAELLLGDTHDLMHKAVGWMLREVGKRCDEALLTGFLDAHAAVMPRTMLRYAIERLPAEQKRYYMAQKSAMLNVKRG